MTEAAAFVRMVAAVGGEPVPLHEPPDAALERLAEEVTARADQGGVMARPELVRHAAELREIARRVRAMQR